jgi:hypothetical protein
MNHTTNQTDPARIALAALARHFDEQRADKTALAEQLREDDSAYYPDYAAIAAAYEDAATTAWAMIGGCPPAAMAEPKHSRISIDLRELGKLVEMATRPPEPLYDLGGGRRVDKDAYIQYLRGTAEHYDKLREALAAAGVDAAHHDDVRRAIDAKKARITELETRLAGAIASKPAATLDRDSVLMTLSRARDCITSFTAFANATEVRDNAAALVQNAINMILDGSQPAACAAVQLSGKSGQFDEGLVEQLVDAYAKGCDSTRHGEDFCKNGIRAILAELATMPCELLEGVLLPAGDATGAAHVVLDMMCPILAAKSAVIDVAHTRIAELEKQLGQALEERDNARGESASRKVHQDELEKRLAEATAPFTVDGKTPGQVLRAERSRIAANGYDDNEAAEHEASAVLRVFMPKPIDVNGKTPGQVNKEAYGQAVMDHHESEGVSAWGIAAQAVLRTHGQALAKQAAVDALGRVRSLLAADTPIVRHFEIIEQSETDAKHRPYDTNKINWLQGFFAGGQWVMYKSSRLLQAHHDTMRFIDDELTKIDDPNLTPVPSDDSDIWIFFSYRSKELFMCIAH